MPFHYFSGLLPKTRCLILFSASLLFCQCGQPSSAKEEKVSKAANTKPASCGTPHSRSGALLNQINRSDTALSNNIHDSKAAENSDNKKK